MVRKTERRRRFMSTLQRSTKLRDPGLELPGRI
jgi:hypothetical protein